MARQALTTTAGRYVFCGTFRPSDLNLTSRTLSGTLLCGVRTFLPAHSRKRTQIKQTLPRMGEATVRSGCLHKHYRGYLSGDLIIGTMNVRLAPSRTTRNNCNAAGSASPSDAYTKSVRDQSARLRRPPLPTNYQMVIEQTLRELEYELESEAGAEYDSPPPPPIPTYKWTVYTNDKDDSKNPWRVHRQIPGRRMNASELRKFESDSLRSLAPTAGPLATQIAIQRCRFSGGKYVVDDPVACRVLDLSTGSISTCTHPRPPAQC
jgi:hypothetical protein